MLREFEYYDSICGFYKKEYSPEIRTKLSKFDDLDLEGKTVYKKEDQIDERSLKRVHSIITDLGKYPGRSVVGKTLEGAAWSVIYDSSLSEMLNYYPYVETAITDRDLHPKYGAFLLDRINVLKGLPQIYGTQHTLKGRVKKLYERKHSPRRTNELRASVGLPLLYRR